MNVETMRLLVAKGLSAEDLLEVAETLNMPKERSAGAIRQARYRARKRGEEEGVTVTGDGNSDGNAPALSPSPNEINSNPHPHTHPESETPRARGPWEFHVLAWRKWREAHPFPRPWWADKQVWDDWLDVRKAKKARNTITAHTGFLRDVEKHADAEWPPGRLLEHAVARSWLSINRPEERIHHDRQPARRTDLRPPASPRGERPNRCLDMVIAAEAEARSEYDPELDWEARPPLRAIGQG